MIKTAIEMAGMYLIMLPFMVMVGAGSLWYFPSKITVSVQSIDEFNRRVPPVVSKVIGLDHNDTTVSGRERMAGIVHMILGGTMSLALPIGQIRDAFRYGNTSVDIVLVSFALLEILTLAYFFDLGRKLVRIERARQESLSEDDA